VSVDSPTRRILYAGADVREPVDLPDDDWVQDRRETYLLRPDVSRPLSVDATVWGRAGGTGAQTFESPLAERPVQGAPLRDDPGEAVSVR
jgi:hypothetical protein